MKMPTKSFAIALAAAIIFSLFTLWLIDSWIKYPIFFFEIVAIILLFFIINDYDLRISTKIRILTGNTAINLILCLALIISSATLLIANILQTQLGIIQTVLSLLCTSLLSGYALLNIFGFRQHFSSLEMVVLSYITSYMLTAFITLVLIVVPENIRAQLITTFFIALGLASMLRHTKTQTKNYSAKESFTKNTDVLAVTLALVFYAFSFCLVYPGFALLSGTDISQHYGRSVVLWRSPDIYIGYAYLLAHSHESAFISLANPSLLSAQTALAILNLMLPLAFYIMAKQHLEKIDRRLPSLAMLFWVLFTNSFGGYAWLYFTSLKLSSTGQTQLQLLSSTADKTYNGTIYGIFGLWYVPATISFILLMTAIFLLGNKELSKAKYFGLFSILTAALYLTHVTEAVVFAFFLAVYGFISKSENYRIGDAILSTIIGLIIVIIVYYALSQLIPRFIMNMSLLISITGPVAALVSSLIFRRYVRPKLPFIRAFKVNRKILTKILVLTIFIAYAVGILSWSSLIDSFHTWQVDTIGLVPWFMYPIMLGVNGLLAITALYHLTEHREPYKAFAFFIAFMIFAFIAGRMVSTINLYFFDAGYWEKRFIWFIKIPLATLAPLPVIYVIDRIRKKEISINSKTVLSLILVGTIVLYGISTTFLNLEYWTEIANNPANHPSPTEMEAINAFKEILNNDPRTWLATVTSRSSAITTFAAPADTLGLKQLLYTAYKPEMAFTQLYRHPAYDHPYIYVHDRDQKELNKYADHFFAKYLSILPIIFKNSEVKIYNASKPSPPQPSSETVLVLPLDKGLGSEEDLYIAYNILSQGFHNYTVAYDLDGTIFDAKTIILAYDPLSEGILAASHQDPFNQALSSYSIVKGNWQIIDGELRGGEIGKYGEGIILSPVSAQNFTASFKAKPLSGNKTVANYISLVYSWVDPKNYRIADILFNTDGYIYVHFRTIIAGVEQAIPTWPGIKTDLKWGFSNKYNITVTVNGTLNQISINDKPYLSVEFNNIQGRIGLRYYRLYQTAFDDFTINYNIKLNLRAAEDYASFLKSGGKIIILNTNGYNFFANSLLTLTNNHVKVEKIGGLNLPKQIVMQKLSLKDPTAAIISNYVGQDGENPYIIKRNYGDGELFYVNIYPIADALRKAENPSAFYPILGKLLGDLNLPKLDKNFILASDGYVKAIDLSGNPKAEAKSLLFPPHSALKQLEIYATKGAIKLYNVTHIQIKSNSNLIIEAEKFTLENGQGFYAVLKLNSTFAIKPLIGLFDVKVATENEEFEITNVEKLLITPRGSVNLLARTPEISTSQAVFTEFYPSSSLQWSTRTYGQNLKVTGLTSFQIMLSDSYTILKNVKLGQSFTREPPLTLFDELSTIPTAIFWTLLLLPIFLGVVLTQTSKRTQQVTGGKAL